jgi:hypothetical protein
LSSVMSLLQRSPIALSSPCHCGMSDSHLLAGNFPASRRIKLRASLRLNRRGRTAKVARHTTLQFLGQNARWRRQRAELQNQCPTTQIDPAQIIIEGSAAYLHLDDPYTRGRDNCGSQCTTGEGPRPNSSNRRLRKRRRGDRALRHHAPQESQRWSVSDLRHGVLDSHSSVPTATERSP